MVERREYNLNFNLFALTGFGNEALAYLHECGFKIQGVYTRKEIGDYPYFEVEHIYDFAQKLDIPIYYIEPHGSWNIRDHADINLVCTFHRIFKQEHLDKASVNINIHPALLPEYKGKNPFRKMLQDRVDHVGITVHKMTEKIDSGETIVHLEYPYKAHNESDLRKSLAEHIREALALTLQGIKNGY